MHMHSQGLIDYHASTGLTLEQVATWQHTRSTKSYQADQDMLCNDLSDKKIWTWWDQSYSAKWSYAEASWFPQQQDVQRSGAEGMTRLQQLVTGLHPWQLLHSTLWPSEYHALQKSKAWGSWKISNTWGSQYTAVNTRQWTKVPSLSCAKTVQVSDWCPVMPLVTLHIARYGRL